MPKQSGQQLIDDFFEALDLMDLEQCQACLQMLDNVAKEDPSYQDWHTYLTGILTYKQDNDWAKSERIFRSLLATDLSPELRGRVLIALGIVCRHQGHFQEALDTYQQCFDVFNQPDQALDRAKVWKNMAIVLEVGFSQGEFDDKALSQAIEYCQLALNVLQDLDQPDKSAQWLEATTWNTLGLIYRNLSDWVAATRCFERRITLGQALNNHYGVGIANHNLGEVLYLQGPDQWPAALQAYKTALEIYQEPEFDDQHRLVDVLTNLALLHHDMGDLDQAQDDYQQVIERIEDLRAGVTSADGRAGYFATVSNTYANFILLCLEMSQIEQAFNLAEQARSRSFLDMLAMRSLDTSQRLEATPLALPDIQALLPDDALLLEYFTTGLAEARLSRTAKQQGIQRHRFPPAKTLCFAISRDTIALYDLGLSPNDLHPSQLGGVVERYFLEPQIRQTLYGRLLGPVSEQLAQTRQLYLVPHGPLHYIPFQTLIAPDGQTLLHEQGPELHYAPSATLLFRELSHQTKPKLAPCLALGYNGEGQTKLHFAEGEAKGIVHSNGGQALTGTDPKKAKLYQQAPAYQRLHFSCHGDFKPDSPLDSALYLGPNETLTALEVLKNLHLTCDLVTLSACESGLSRVRRGDELVGFVRAFMNAGTSALVCTLWRVDECSTWLLMEKFYQALQQGAPIAQALKTAQLYLKQLTRQEVLDTLARFAAEERDDPPSTMSDLHPNPAPTANTWGPYLKGFGHPSDRADVLLEGPANEKIFADPFYWGPFILVGHHEASVVRRL